MNIMEIVSGAQINGAVVHCALLSRELALRGHSVTLMCRPDAKVRQLVAGHPVRIIESDMHRFPLDELRKMSRISESLGIEIMHTHMTRAHNFGAMLQRFARIPCVATAHSHIVQPLTWMFNDYVIAVSEATRRFQQRYNFVRSSRIETVHGFTDVDRQASVPSDARATVRRSLGLTEAMPIFGIIGDIIPRKGHLYVVRALAEIVRRKPDAKMLVVGDPKRKIGRQYFERVQSETRRLGLDNNIIWAGYRGDVPNVMKSLDVYVLASLDEMLPVAVLDAMAARMSIVATSVGGVPECLTNDRTALLVPCADPAALAVAILRLLEDRTLASHLAERAHFVARERFSLESQTPLIEAVFQRVIDRRQGTGAGRREGSGRTG